ncbi:hypothetical protein P9G41_18865, partial [Bacillus amyloliquefaciens]|nr:hypothetical protein [Bacillus amyloliquefaciens]
SHAALISRNCRKYLKRHQPVKTAEAKTIKLKLKFLFWLLMAIVCLCYNTNASAFEANGRTG